MMSIETPTGGETVRAVGEAAGPGTRPAPTLTPREQEAAHHARECAGHLRALRAILHARGSLQFDENILFLQAWTAAWASVAALEGDEPETVSYTHLTLPTILRV